MCIYRAALLPDLHAVDSRCLGPGVPHGIGDDPRCRDRERLFGGVDHHLAAIAVLPVGQRQSYRTRAGKFPPGILIVVQFDGATIREL